MSLLCGTPINGWLPPNVKGPPWRTRQDSVLLEININCACLLLQNAKKCRFWNNLTTSFRCYLSQSGSAPPPHPTPIPPPVGLSLTDAETETKNFFQIAKAKGDIQTTPVFPPMSWFLQPIPTPPAKMFVRPCLKTKLRTTCVTHTCSKGVPCCPLLCLTKNHPRHVNVVASLSILPPPPHMRQPSYPFGLL